MQISRVCLDYIGIFLVIFPFIDASGVYFRHFKLLIDETFEKLTTHIESDVFFGYSVRFVFIDLKLTKYFFVL